MNLEEDDLVPATPEPPRATSFAELVARARGLAASGRRAVLGVAGSPGSGKTTLAESLCAELPAGWVAHVPMDGFHLADVELDRLGLRDRKGAPETFDAHGYVALLRRIVADDPTEVIYAPTFARDLEQPVAGAVPVRPEHRLVVTEGNYLLLGTPPWDRVRRLVTEIWYCDQDDAVRLDRLVRRHVRFGKAPDAALAWAHGTDERNARAVAAGRDHAALLVRREILDALTPPG